MRGFHQDVRYRDETLSQVFGISAHKRFINEEKTKKYLKSSEPLLITTGYPNILHACDFLCSHLLKIINGFDIARLRIIYIQAVCYFSLG